MVETLYSVDSALFVAVNQSLANPVTDALMPLITNDNFLRIGYALAMALVLWRGDSRLRWAALASAVVIALADQLSSAALKPLFERARPCHDGALESVRLLVNCGAGKSFPSSHAANAFAVCVYFPVALA
ncbi:MAG TPA: phosphatase PAP2 family protein, partial [candidate division Zixibacteria bacterium]|nr:phosphatase PAP2 family protein [candidate division Zixibacteria bacterium]